MESFKVYLPSNACHNIYPNNTASNYQTHFDRAISLDGEWEVGVESVFYSPHIKDKNDKIEIHGDVKLTNYSLNDTNTFKFLLTEDGKWKGIDGIIPTKFEEDAGNLDSVAQTLNNMNSLVLEGATAFTFSRRTCRKNPKLKDFFVKITPNMAKVFGYVNWGLIYGDYEPEADWYYRTFDQSHKLTAEDYRLQYFYANAQRKEARIVLKPRDCAFTGGVSSFSKLWSEKLKDFDMFQLHLRFKKGKAIISNFSEGLVFAFSPDLAKALSHNLTIISRSTAWGWESAQIYGDHTSEEWYIDVYSAELELHKSDLHFSLDVFPWQYDTTKEVMKYVNQQVKQRLMEELNKIYDAKKHRFQLSLSRSGYSNLVVGSELQIHFSENFYFPLALSETISFDSVVNGSRRIGNKIKRQKELFILSNIAKPTAYGQHHLQILQNFLHRPNQTDLIEKRFYPIVYLPLMSNTIDMLQLQVTDNRYNPVKFADSKTLMCLYFRKSEKRA